MVNKYKRRYACICSALACSIFLAACFLALELAQNSLKNDSNTLFDTQCAAIESLISTKQIDLARFYELQQKSSIGVALYENEQYISLLSPYSEAQQDIVKVYTTQLKEKGYSFSSPPNVYTSFSQDTAVLDKMYHIKWISFCVDNSTWRNAFFYSSIESQSVAIHGLVRKYVAFFVIGSIVIVLLSFMLAHYSVKPLEQAMKSQKEFIAMASHELKTPLSVITSSVQMTEIDKQETPRYLNVIFTEAKKMSNLVGDLLLLSSVDAGGFAYKKSNVNIEQLLFSLYEKYLLVAKEHNHSLTIKTPDYNVPEIHADGARLEQAFSTLINNAIEHTPENTRVTISLQVVKAKTVVKIIDNGQGMSDDEKKRAFDKFYQGGTPQTENHFGLGLPIAHEIFSAHKYAVSLEDAENGGLCVSVTIPNS